MNLTNRLLLDSTFLIDFLRNKQEAVDFLGKQSGTFYTTEINAFELFRGIFKDNQQKLESVNNLLARIVVLPFERRSSLKAGQICGLLDQKGKKIGEVDCLIAGIALTNGVNHIVTANEKHFSKIKEISVVSY